MNIRRFIIILLIFEFFLMSSGFAGDQAPRKEIDINTASAQEFSAIPSIDSKLADAIVTYRDRVGGFVIFEELLQVEGFSQDLFLKVKSYLYLEGMSAEDCGC